MNRVLFVLKRREDYCDISHSVIGLSTGLYNSASFVHKLLVKNHIHSKMVVVTDNNDIDREVTLFKPTHVIIEALWVVPEKFAILQKLHPTVKWIIRLHSEMPFMANEGIAMRWLGDYSQFRNVSIAVNAPRMLTEVRFFLQHKNRWTTQETNFRVFYLPNYYPQEYLPPKRIDRNRDFIDIGCFGAIRPLKNHLLQTFAALEFADRNDLKLRFHVNAGRIEMKGDSVLHNLKGLFEQVYSRGHRLINHQWTPREDFLELCGQMDIGMQVSFTETFNIVGADLTSQGVPIVMSSEVPWTTWPFRADPTNSRNIIANLEFAYKYPTMNVKIHQKKLKKYTNKVEQIWIKEFGD